MLYYLYTTLKEHERSMLRKQAESTYKGQYFMLKLVEAKLTYSSGL